MTNLTLSCAVLPGAERTLREALARDLFDSLIQDPELLGSGTTIGYAELEPARPGGKGTAVDLTTLLLSSITTAPAVLGHLVRLVQAWCGKDGRRRVRITAREHVIEITGNPTRAQQKVIAKFLEAHESGTTPPARS